MARAFKLHGSKELLRQLRKAKREILPDLAPVIDATARRALTEAQPFIPTNEDGLRTAGYREPAEIHRGDAVVSAVAGFDTPTAAYVHEGYVNARWIGAAPRFMRKGAQRARTFMRKSLLSAVNASLARIFRSK